MMLNSEMTSALLNYEAMKIEQREAKTRPNVYQQLPLANQELLILEDYCRQTSRTKIDVLSELVNQLSNQLKDNE
jgi:hypothetical protein